MSEFEPSPGLVALAKHARNKADLRRNPAEIHEAKLWRQIADEIDSYLDEPAPVQDDLFADPPPRSDGYHCDRCRNEERE